MREKKKFGARIEKEKCLGLAPHSEKARVEFEREKRQIKYKEVDSYIIYNS